MSIPTKTKKRSKTIGTILGVTLLVTAANVFCTTKFIIPEREANAIDSYLEESSVIVNVVNADLPTGSTLEGSIIQTSMPSALVPSNAIIGDYDFDKLVSKINLAKNTVLTTDMMVNPFLDDEVDDTTRTVEVTYVENGLNIETGDYIDIRFRRYSTQDSDEYEDLIVVSKKKVIQKEGTTLYLNLSESDILNLGTAAAEAVLTNYDSRSQLYSTEYVDPYNQERAAVTYSNPALTQQIIENPDIAESAKEELSEKINQ